MKVTFTPLTAGAVDFLTWKTGIDFRATDFRNENDWSCCTVYDRDYIAAVVVFEFKTPFDAHISLAVDNPKVLSRQLICTLANVAFLRAARITALIEPANKPALSQVWRLGFKYEGYIRRGLDGVRDAVAFGMLPEDCPYLAGLPFVYRVVAPTHAPAAGVQ